jgi:hypothetical protein
MPGLAEWAAPAGSRPGGYAHGQATAAAIVWPTGDLRPRRALEFPLVHPRGHLHPTSESPPVMGLVFDNVEAGLEIRQ